MDKLKEIENAVSEIENCLQKQLMEARSKEKSTDLMSLISQLPQDELAHTVFPSDHFSTLSRK